MAARTGIVKGFSDKSSPAAGAFLEMKRRVKNISACAGALALESHDQFTGAFWTLILAKKDLEIKFLDPLLEINHPRMHLENCFQ